MQLRGKVSDRRLSRKRRRDARRVEVLDSSSSDEEGDHADEEEVEEAWNLVLETLPKLFFVDEEASLSNVDKMKMYSGVKVSHTCLLDLRAIYDHKFDAYGQIGHEPFIYKALKSVVGQLLRLLVPKKNISKKVLNVLWKEGYLFRAVSSARGCEGVHRAFQGSLNFRLNRFL